MIVYMDVTLRFFKERGHKAPLYLIDQKTRDFIPFEYVGTEERYHLKFNV